MPRARRDHEQTTAPADPGAIDQMGHHGAVDAARGAQVGVFYAGGSAEGAELERASSRSRLWSVPGIVERAGRWSDGATRVISLYERYLVATIYL